MKRTLLRPILELNRQGTDRAAHALAEASERARIADQRLDGARAHAETIERELRTELDHAHALGVEGRLRAADLALLDSYHGALTARIADGRSAVRRVEAELDAAVRAQEKARVDLAVTRGEEKTLRAHEARLREDAQRRAEEKETDEVLDALQRGETR